MHSRAKFTSALKYRILGDLLVAGRDALETSPAYDLRLLPILRVYALLPIRFRKLSNDQIYEPVISEPVPNTMHDSLAA
jgi:hypothetical protein